MADDWTEQTTINKKGDRCVVETNWETHDGPRCQMIWQRTPGGGCQITTCRQDVPPIALTRDQCSTLSDFLGVNRNGRV